MLPESCNIEGPDSSVMPPPGPSSPLPPAIRALPPRIPEPELSFRAPPTEAAEFPPVTTAPPPSVVEELPPAISAKPPTPASEDPAYNKTDPPDASRPAADPARTSASPPSPTEVSPTDKPTDPPSLVLRDIDPPSLPWEAFPVESVIDPLEDDVLVAVAIVTPPDSWGAERPDEIVTAPPGPS